VAYFSKKCITLREESIWSLFQYSVYTRGQAISDIILNIDFALWDTELAKKKLVTIDDKKQ
jgi:hypothetical protein